MFSKIYLRSGYHQVCIKEEYIYKNTFRMRYKHYELMVFSFDITNAPSSFMCLMKNVFHTYLDKFMIVFIDDILIYYNNEEENVENLEAVLRLMR